MITNPEIVIVSEFFFFSQQQDVVDDSVPWTNFIHKLFFTMAFHLPPLFFLFVTSKTY